MPGSILNADINFPHFTGQETTDEKLGIVTDYLYMLYEQLRYSMSNLGVENFNDAELKDIITMSAKQIDLTGYVTFNSLSTPGQTIIDGANISTGTISADRLYLTGAISWGDLTAEAQQRVDSGKGDPNPTYIHSAYISSTEIRSPTIKATDFSVYPSSGDASGQGSYNIYGTYAGSQYHMFRLRYGISADTPVVAFESPASAYANWNFAVTDVNGIINFGTQNGCIQRPVISSIDYGSMERRPDTGRNGQLYFVI